MGPDQLLRPVRHLPLARPPEAAIVWGLRKARSRRGHMRRREFVTLLCGTAVAAWPVAASAQQSAKPVVGFLSVSSPGLHVPFVAAFNQGLREVGFIEGQNL